MKQAKTFNNDTKCEILFIINYVKCTRNSLVIHVILLIMMIQPVSSFATGEGFLGIGTSISYDRDGLLVERVRRDSPADRANLREGDIIRQLNGKNVYDDESGFWYFIRKYPRRNILLTIESEEGEIFEENVRIGEHNPLPPINTPNQAYNSPHPEMLPPTVINNFYEIDNRNSENNHTIQTGDGNEASQEN